MGDLVYSSVINHPRDAQSGFDSAFIDASRSIFVLCDGANSSPEGGKTARTLSFEFGIHFAQTSIDDIPALLLELHNTIRSTASHTGSTLVGARITDKRLEYVSVGDSYMYIYKRRPVLGWIEQARSLRDVDAEGNPWQLIGSPVYCEPQLGALDASGNVCVVMMSDGAGNFIHSREITELLELFKRSSPSQCDLEFCTNELARTAYSRGSRDDISVIMIWVER